MNAHRTSLSVSRLSSRILLGFLGVASVLSVACGGDDFAGLDQYLDSSDAGPHTGDSDASFADASTSDASTSDASTSDAGPGATPDAAPGIVSDASPISVVVGADAGACKTVSGVFNLTPAKSGNSLLCPTAPLLCNVSTSLLTCAVSVQCTDPTGKAVSSLLDIPAEVLSPSNDFTYNANLPIPEIGTLDAGSLGASCGVQFGDDSVALGVSCTATVPVVGTVDVCAYAGLPIDGGL